MIGQTISRHEILEVAMRETWASSTSPGKSNSTSSMGSNYPRHEVVPLGKGIDISTEGNLPDDLDGGRPRIRPADVGIDWKSTPFSERNPSGFE